MQRYLEENPTEVEGEAQLGQETYPIFKSQPIPNGFVWNPSALVAETMLVYLTGLGHGQYLTYVHSHVPHSRVFQPSEPVSSLLPTTLGHLLSAHRRQYSNLALGQRSISGP